MKPPERIAVDDLATLLIGFRDGRPGAIDRLIAGCWPVVERQARRFARRPSDVDDIVQEVWIRLVEHASDIREPRATLAWLLMVTRRTALQLGRRDSRLVLSEPDAEPSVASTEEQALRAEQRRAVVAGVHAALDRLPADDRHLLVTLVGAGDGGATSYQEASRQLGRPVGSLGPTRRRLLDRLRVDPAVRRLCPAA
jgi:RNA polymerase sigma factor (sigma-70 family)